MKAEFVHLTFPQGTAEAVPDDVRFAGSEGCLLDASRRKERFRRRKFRTSIRHMTI